MTIRAHICAVSILADLLRENDRLGMVAPELDEEEVPVTEEEEAVTVTSLVSK